MQVKSRGSHAQSCLSVSPPPRQAKPFRQSRGTRCTPTLARTHDHMHTNTQRRTLWHGISTSTHPWSMPVSARSAEPYTLPTPEQRRANTPPAIACGRLRARGQQRLRARGQQARSTLMRVKAEAPRAHARQHFRLTAFVPLRSASRILPAVPQPCCQCSRLPDYLPHSTPTPTALAVGTHPSAA